MSEIHISFNITEEINLPLQILMAVFQKILNCTLTFRVLATFVIISMREIIFFLHLGFNFID